MAEAIDVETLYDLTLPAPMGGVTLSPAGDMVAFVADEFDETAEERLSSVYIMPTDGNRKPHRLSRASTASNPVWSPDGSKLAVLAARDEDIARRAGRSPEENDETDEPSTDVSETDESDEEEQPDLPEDDEPRPQVWMYDLEFGGDARQVTDFDEGVSEFDFSPDGDHLVVAARDPTDEQTEYLAQRRNGGPIEVERLQHKADGAGWLDEVKTYLFVIDVDGEDEPERLDEAYGQGAAAPMTGLKPVWGENRIAFLSNRTDNPDDSQVMDVYTIVPDGSDLRQITDSDVLTFLAEWDNSGERLAFVAWTPDNFYKQAELYIANATTGDYQSISTHIDREVSFSNRVRWLEDDTVVALIADEGLTRPAIFDVDGGESHRAFSVQGRDRELTGFDVRGETVAALLSHPTDGPDLFAAGVESLHDSVELTRLTKLNNVLEDIHTPRVERVEVENDGTTIESIVYLPDEFDPNDPTPTAAFLPSMAGQCRLIHHDTPSKSHAGRAGATSLSDRIIAAQHSMGKHSVKRCEGGGGQSKPTTS